MAEAVALSLDGGADNEKAKLECWYMCKDWSKDEDDEVEFSTLGDEELEFTQHWRAEVDSLIAEIEGKTVVCIVFDADAYVDDDIVKTAQILKSKGVGVNLWVAYCRDEARKGGLKSELSRYNCGRGVAAAACAVSFGGLRGAARAPPNAWMLCAVGRSDEFIEMVEDKRISKELLKDIKEVLGYDFVRKAQKEYDTKPLQKQFELHAIRMGAIVQQAMANEREARANAERERKGREKEKKKNEAMVARLAQLERQVHESGLDGGGGQAPGRAADYNILEKLGEGAFGAVYRGQVERNGDRVAIKIINLTNCKQKKSADAELKTVRAVHHPNIVRYCDHFVDKRKHMCVVMELCNGGSLSPFLGTTTSHIVYAWFAQTVSAIAFLHSKGIMHRDIKPNNVLLVRDKNKIGGHTVRVADFGLSRKMAETAAQASTFAGTTAYMSPQHFGGQRLQYSMKSDVWSLGVLLYAMAEGKTPFGTNVTKIIRGAYPPLSPTRPKHLATLVKEMLVVKQEERLTADEVERRLRTHSWH